MTPTDYAITITPLPINLGGGYFAVAPELPGCISDGETPEEALANTYDVIADRLIQQEINSLAGRASALC